jgi:hypothetical protein
MISGLTSTSVLGLIVLLGVIGTPVYVLLFGTMLNGPRAGKVKGVFIGTIFGLAVAAIAATWIFATTMSLIVPG